MISVITPVWNEGHLTHAFLSQNWIQYHGSDQVEWVIVNNGSVDNTPAVLLSWRARMKDRLQVIVNEKNEGFPIACNQGARAARGDVLVFLNNDVTIGGDYLGVIERALQDNPGAIVGAQLLKFDTGWNTFSGVIVPYLAGWCVACTRSTFGDLGGFDERYSPCDYEDMDFSFKAAKRGRELLELHLSLRHLSGQTGRQMADRRAITERNRAKFAEKWQL